MITDQFVFREATLEDIPAMQHVRGAVTENRLNNPLLVTTEHYVDYIEERGKGWVCVDGELLVGFAIVDLRDNNVWALFVLPEYEGRGIGSTLQKLMLDWFFATRDETLWLSTATGTRAAAFYRLQHWKEAGPYGNNEIRFEMDAERWREAHRPYIN